MIPKFKKILTKLAKLSDSSSSKEVDEIYDMVDEMCENQPAFVKKAWIDSIRQAKQMKTSSSAFDSQIEKLQLHSDTSKRTLIVNLIKLCFEMEYKGVYFDAKEVAKRLHISKEDRHKFMHEYNKMLIKAKNIENFRQKSLFGSGIFHHVGMTLFYVIAWLFKVVFHFVSTGPHYLIFFAVCLFVVNVVSQYVTDWRIWLARKIDPRARREIIPKIMDMLDIPR
jgi:hypothetical protein